MREESVVVFGASGQLGRQLMARGMQLGLPMLGIDRSVADLAYPDQVQAVMRRIRPRFVVNAAAWTDVDRAETQEALAFEVNAFGVAGLAECCAHVGVPLLHVSTDYVFGGTAPGRLPWSEAKRPCPASAYARSKEVGERAVRLALPHSGTVVRTAWLYSADSRNFVTTMRERAAASMPSQVVDDQWGQPTWARDAADQILALGIKIERGSAPCGTYHATSSGAVSRFTFAQALYVLCGKDPSLVSPISSDQLTGRASRPHWSVLGHEAWAAAGMSPLNHWYPSLLRAAANLRLAPT